MNGSSYHENAPSLWLAHFPRPDAASNKYTRGAALLYGGAMTGAGRLSALCAARSGAGLVTLACPASVFTAYASALPACVIVAPLKQRQDFNVKVKDGRFNAILVGPGAGIGEATRANALAALASGKAAVLDADALTVFKGDVAGLRSAVAGPLVLTPHEGEFGRLFDVSGSRLERAQAAAALCRAVVVLKGSDTVIASADGRAIVNSNAPSTLATGGSGDALSGIITGLLAQGMPAFEAAACGVWLHAEAARLFGPGLIADDIPLLLPQVLTRIF